MCVPRKWPAPTALAQISVGNILLHHALRVEERTIDRDGVAHHFKVAVAVLKKHRQDYALQFRVEALCVQRVIHRSLRPGIAAMRFPDGPPGHALDATLDPPAVQNA